MSKARKANKVYVVERVAYKAWDFDGLHYSPCGGDDGESYVPVRAFQDEAAAVAHCAELTAEARRTLPPALFASGEVPKGLAARLQKLGLTPPKFRKPSYEHGDQFARWWAKHATAITPEQQADIWELFANVELYRVTSVEME